MKKALMTLLLCAFAATAGAQYITHRFNNVAMPDALKYIQAHAGRTRIIFIYNELEDFKVTATVEHKSARDAIMQLVGFYPIRVTEGDDHELYVECIQKTRQKYIGHVADRNGRPIEFANVALLNARDSSFITGGVTRSDGLFVIPCDVQPVLARVSCVGYQTLLLPLATFQPGTIRMREDVKTLREVKVTTIRPTVTYKSDRYVVDIANSLMATGNTAASLLTQLPGVWVSGTSIAINGVTGATVMVNDRAVQLTGDQLMNYLKTLRSENIDKIEIIANPSAEFPAQGAGGVLRILTRKRQSGTQLYFGSTVDFIDYNALKPYLSYSYSKGKFGVDASASGTFGKGYLRADELTQNRKSLVDYDNRDTDRMNDCIYSLNTNLYYDFNDRNRLALNLNFYHWYKHEHITGTTIVSGENAPEIRKTATQHGTVQNDNEFNASLNYTHLFGAEGQNKLLVLADAVRTAYPIDDEFEYQNYNAAGALLSTEHHTHQQHAPFSILSGETRVQWDFKSSGNLMAGVKYSHSEKDNDFVQQTLTGGQWTVDEGYGYDFKYYEDLQATYLKYEFARRRWSLSAGLRAEYDRAHAKGYAQTYHHFDIFPNLFYTLHVGTKHTVSISAARRTQRVNFIRLIPYRYYHSRYTVMTGNPQLRPDYSNHLSLTCQIADKYQIALTHVWSNNGIDSYNRTETIGGETLTVASYVDGVRERLTHLNAFLPVNISKWWSVVNQLRASYDRYESTEATVHNFDWSAYTQHTIILPWALRFQLLYRYQSKSKSAYGWTNAWHTIDASWMKTFLNDRLTVKLAVSDLICGQRNRSYVRTGFICQEMAMYGRRVPSFSLSVFYSISKGKRRQHADIERSNRDEKSRAL